MKPSLKKSLLSSLALAALCASLPIAALAQAPTAPAPAVETIIDQAAPVEQAQPATVPEAIAALLSTDQAKATGDTKRRYEAIARFYQDRGNLPLWVEGDHFSTKAQAIIARIGRAAEDGLNPASFTLPDPAFKAAAGSDATALATEEAKLSLALVTFAEQASGGQIVPSQIYKDITRKPQRIKAQDALYAALNAADVDTALDGFNPPNPQFKRLKAKLAEWRAADHATPPPPVALAKTIKPGMSDVGVPALRTRFRLPDQTDPTQVLVYDDALVQAVEAFQTENNLTPDGVVGPRTLGIINAASQNIESDIIANMEMWRWMPRDLSRDYVFVNVPEFMVRVFRHGTQVHEARVVVGKVTNQTPIFSGEMQYLVVNPYWNVPQSIKIKEMLPDIQADPAGYFARHGYEATWNGQVIDPATVIWDENAVKAVGIRQVPGEANALGHIKFMFPNQHAVYLHDTPSRKLFGRDVRAFSHGCVRVDDPMSFASAVLEGDPNWNVPRLESLFGGPEQRVDIATHLQVHIAYFTVAVDDQGNVKTWDDIYGHVRKIKAALGISDT
ncbi:L,D-transpeptidase family protein [Oryzibacter oryziterrae]|uniref:L,D-transpeptidase family protein n=1 Tax=Oryzibacter oryziterrae TaxID=2766474 RepID=UPI001F02DA30|nr:L,D-transpeptidase family protein [Oryzibacter oryziterrae]